MERQLFGDKKYACSEEDEFLNDENFCNNQLEDEDEDETSDTDEVLEAKSVKFFVRPVKTPSGGRASSGEAETSEENIFSEESGHENEFEEINEDRGLEHGKTVPPSYVRINSNKLEVVDAAYDADDEDDGDPVRTFWELSYADFDNRRRFLHHRMDNNEPTDAEANLIPDTPPLVPTKALSVQKPPEVQYVPPIERVPSFNTRNNLKKFLCHRMYNNEPTDAEANLVSDSPPQDPIQASSVQKPPQVQQVPPIENFPTSSETRNRRRFIRHRMDNNEPTDAEANLAPDYAPLEPTEYKSVQTCPQAQQDLRIKNVTSSSSTPNIGLETPPAWWKLRGKKKSSASKIQDLATNSEKSTRPVDVPECPARTETPPAWWNLYGLMRKRKSLQRVHPSAQPETEIDRRIPHVQGEIENPTAVFVPMVEDIDGNLEVKRGSGVQRKRKNTKVPGPQLDGRVEDPQNIPRPPSRKHGTSDVKKNGSKRRTSVGTDIQDGMNDEVREIPRPLPRKQESSQVKKTGSKHRKPARTDIPDPINDNVRETTLPPSRKHGHSDLRKTRLKPGASVVTDTRNPEDDMRNIRRPPSRKHGFVNVPKVKKIQGSLVTDSRDLIDDVRKIQRPPSRKYGFSDISKSSFSPESTKTQQSSPLVPDENGTCRKIRVQHAKPQRKVCRTGDPEGRPWKAGRIPHFDLRTACSRATFERLTFIREDFKLTPSQEKITDMNEFIAAKTEYLRIKAGGKPKVVETLHVSKVKAKESREDPDLFGEEAWPLPTGEHVPPAVTLSLKGNMSSQSFLERVVPVLEEDFDVAILEPAPPLSRWKRFKNAFKCGRNRPPAEPNGRPKPEPIPAEPSSSWFGRVGRRVRKRWTRLTRNRHREGEGEMGRTQSLCSARESRICINPMSIPENERVRVRKPKKVNHRCEDKTSREGNSPGEKPDDDNNNSRPRCHRKSRKYAGTKVKSKGETTSIDRQDDEPENSNSRHRRRRKSRKTTGVTSEKPSTSTNTKGEEPKNPNLVPRRHRSSRSHRRPD